MGNGEERGGYGRRNRLEADLLPGTFRGGDADYVLELARLELLADALDGKVRSGSGAKTNNHTAGNMVIDRLVPGGMKDPSAKLSEGGARGRQIIPGELLGLVGGGHLGHHAHSDGAAKAGGGSSGVGGSAGGEDRRGGGEGRGAGDKAVERNDGRPHLCEWQRSRLRDTNFTHSALGKRERGWKGTLE